MALSTNRDEFSLPTISTVPAPTHGLSTYAATFLIVGEIAGIGILALSDACVKAGYASFFMLPFFCILSTYTARLLCECWNILRHVHPECRSHVPNPYPVIGQKSFGRVGEFIVTTSINLTLFGAMVVFIVLGGDLMHGIFTSWHIGNVTFCLWMIIIASALTPLSWFGTPKDFWWIAVLAVCATGIASVLIVVNAFRVSPSISEASRQLSPFDPKNFFLAVGTIMFAFSGHPAFPTINIDMKHPEKFTRSSILAYVIVMAMYLPVAYSGFFIFGGSVEDNIVRKLNDYLQSDVINTIIQVSILLHLISAFAIVSNPVLQHAEELFHIENKLSAQRLLLRTVLVLVALFCAESVPQFGVLVSLVGSSTNAMLVYVIPCACYLRLKHQLVKQNAVEDRLPVVVQALEFEERLALPIPKWEKILQYFIISIGLFGVLSGTTTSIMSIAGTSSFIPPCYVNFSLVID